MQYKPVLMSVTLCLPCFLDIIFGFLKVKVVIRATNSKYSNLRLLFWKGDSVTPEREASRDVQYKLFHSRPTTFSTNRYPILTVHRHSDRSDGFAGSVVCNAQIQTILIPADILQWKFRTRIKVLPFIISFWPGDCWWRNTFCLTRKRYVTSLVYCLVKRDCGDSWGNCKGGKCKNDNREGNIN